MDKKYIKDREGNRILPITHVTAVLDNDGNDVVSLLGTKTDESAFTAHTSDSVIHVTSAQTAAWDAKQDTLSAGTGIEISGNVISATGGGGGGKAIEAGTNISVTTGETADTINCTLPMTTNSVTKIVVDSNYSSFVTSDAAFTANSLSNSIILGNNTFNINGVIKGKINNNLIIGKSNRSQLTNGVSPTLEGNLVVGSNNQINSAYSLLVGNNSTIDRSYQFVIGFNQNPKNEYEISLGKYNNSVSGSSTFGDSGNTLFSVGNGTAVNARHNAFEIRQNGDIYLTLDGQDVKLQDQLGGGITSGDVQSMIESALTPISETIEDNEEVTAQAINELNDAVSANTTALGGLSIVKLTQAQYDALSPNYDNNTLYVIVN